LEPDGSGGAPPGGSGREPVATVGAIAAATPTTFGKYHLFASLGRGGMADVYLAVAHGPMGFNKLAVVKRLRSSLSDEPSFLNMFLDEARLAARLNHPNVVHTYEVGEHDGSYFIAMEFLEGQSLNKIIREASRTGVEVPVGVATRIVSDALLGLHHAHELRDYDGRPLEIIHRDISPHNVFVTYEGVVKLVDFGIAKAALSSTQTEVGVLKGKVAYMSPEQAMGSAIDRRADVFSMGIVLWELLTRKRLMTGDSAAATLNRLLNTPVPRVSAALPSVDPDLDAIVAKALEKDPARRYQTALEMREALEAWTVSSGRVARPEAVGQKVSQMFAAVREQVRMQIQAYMAAMASSQPTPEFGLTSLRRSSDPSALYGGTGTGTGTGSGVVPLGEGSASLAPEELAEITAARERREKRTLLGVFAALLLVLTGISFLIFRSSNVTLRRPTAPSVTASAQTPAPPEAPTLAVSDTPPPMTVTAQDPKPKPAPMPPPTTKPAAALTSKPAATATQQEDTGPGFLSFDSFPWTHVSEGGRSLGTTPLFHVSLSPGPHTLVLENADQGIHTSYTVVIKSGESVSKRIGLK
jgi:eukaryotic-like serine/threonine-protein kinase